MPVDTERNEQLVIEIAISVMQGKGWIDEPDDELVQTLKRLYQANPACRKEVKLTGELLRDMAAGRPGEYLAAVFERECEERWEREEAERWSCPCGFTFALHTWGPYKTTFYTLTDDGLFDETASACPQCKRDLAKTREKHAHGQLGFAF